MHTHKLLGLSHPRSGSKSFANALSESGLDIGHEILGCDGMVSWWHTAGFSKPDNKRLFYCKRSQCNIKPLILVHLLRSPLDAIPSIILENEFNNRNNNSFRHRSTWIMKRFGVDLSGEERISAAIKSYVFWNLLIEDLKPDLIVRIEHVESDCAPLSAILEISTQIKAKRFNQSINKYPEAVKAHFTYNALVGCVDYGTVKYLNKYMDMYG